jgi:hypothetical protein
MPRAILLPMLGASAALLAAGGCTDDEPGRARRPTGMPPGPTATVSDTDFGSAWPFSVPRGVLACDGGSLVFGVGDDVFALNEPARADGYPPVNPIWRWDDSVAPDLRKSLAPVLERARELCR